ncbi:MAG: DUF4376 domain-containing protein [Gammaproteobacteria bacterium]|nr:DUF4376 domain-containing protein [Gammaproteobacteria bacterium]MCP4488154.1 DUF4376 domain-containing protein [Gammaproteobacteria bacterium]
MKNVAYTSGGYVTNIAVHEDGYSLQSGEYLVNDYTHVGQVTKFDGSLIDTAQPSSHHYFDNSELVDDWVVASEDLDDFIEHRCDEVDALLLTKLAADFTYNTYDWQVNFASQQAISARYLYAQASIADDTTYPWDSDVNLWRDSGNDDRTFATAANFVSFAVAVSAHITGLQDTAMRTHKDALRALGTFGAVEDYDITASW